VPVETPETIPVDPTMAVDVADDDQVPPNAISVRVMELPVQTEVRPVIMPAVGEGFIVTALDAIAVPHELIAMYSMLSVPADIPVAMPNPETLALPSVELHKPPGVPSVYAEVTSVQIVDAPDMTPAYGNGLMVITFIAADVPQVFVTVYLIVSKPGDTPVIIPPIIDAVALVQLHMPLGEASDKVMVDAGQTVDGPVIEPADGNGFTVIVSVVASVLQG